jgi:hypothetical protein
MKKTTKTVTFAGQTFTRTTGRTYTHMLVGKRPEDADSAQHRALTWCGRLDLAQKAIANWRKLGYVDVQIVEVP